jgi:hypothetical protein
MEPRGLESEPTKKRHKQGVHGEARLWLFTHEEIEGNRRMTRLPKAAPAKAAAIAQQGGVDLLESERSRSSNVAA